ncbi:MFS transporter [Burkholderia sp. FERM BP-3421]|uniref:MFS transporter n=1 Tax=Burkholderia sp. FERM BP-3421 TaxID=1494466 RepID=UPI00235F8814|nr:MFS transporter [Burkholderia sp. FERM BP-3421]WDD93979.1 MFS transporter [Burkholderia sp. FERM BP-3421]
MSAAPGRPTRPGLARLRADLFPWTLALLTGLDYFDNATFSFFASYIAGGINASPDELVWASSAYAVTAVLGILQQQWWVDRLGHRRYLAASMLMFSLGALAAALADTSLQLAFARGFQGYFIGPMMGACRILIQISFAPTERPPATRAFLILLLLGSALAPIAGGLLVAHFTWRALFACTVPAGIACAGIALLVVPDGGETPPDARGSAHFWPYVIFAFAQGALQIVMQQVRFELFAGSPQLILLTVGGLGALAWFVHHQWRHPTPLVRLHAFRESTFRVGLLLYMFYYYETTGYSYLISRFLESGLDYPVENAGRLVGTMSLISASALFVYLRYAKRITHKKWIIVPGFALGALAALWIARLPPDAGEAALIMPLLLRGLLLLFIVLPVANLTFRVFAIDEYTHGYRLKNIVRQLTISFATASVIIVEQHRQALHQTRLVEQANVYNPIFQHSVDVLTRHFAAAGHALGEAHTLALVSISQTIVRQAAFLTSLDGFYFLAAVAICGGVFATWQKEID